VVHPDLHYMAGTFEKVSPLFKGSNDCEHLLVMDLVVPFDHIQALQHEGDQVPFFVFGQKLRENSPSGKVQTISLNLKGLHQIRQHQHGSSGDELLELLEGGKFHFAKVKRYCFLCEVMEGLGNLHKAFDEVPIEVEEPYKGLGLLQVL
jgi:hypothetical protein